MRGLAVGLVALTGFVSVSATPSSAIDGRVQQSAATRTDAVFARFGDDEPGCAVGVGTVDRVLLSRGYGVADLDVGTPLTRRSVFDTASVSKQMTAAIVYLLEADGALSIDDDVRRWVPELSDWGAVVSLDHLIHHTSGLPDYTALLDAPESARTTKDDALNVIAAVPELSFSPGSRFEYSNTNYFLLSVVAERATGRAFRSLVDERIFQPLGMRRSIVRDDADANIPRLAIGYSPNGDTFDTRTSDWEQTGDGAVQTTVVDLLRWARNLSTFEVGGDDLKTAMFSRGPRADEDGYDYGGGLVLDRSSGELIVEHSGSWAGYVADLVVRPGDGLGVVVLCNRDDADPFALAERVFEIWSEDSR